MIHKVLKALHILLVVLFSVAAMETAALGMRGYDYREFRVGYPGETETSRHYRVAVFFYEGTLSLELKETALAVQPPLPTQVTRSWGPFSFHRFVFQSAASKGDEKEYEVLRSVGLPWWVASVVLVVYPTGALMRWTWLYDRRRRRHKKGLCVRCGYNLTGNISSICPECGHACD